MSTEAKIRKEARARLSKDNWGRGVAITAALLSVPLFYLLFLEMMVYLVYPQMTGSQTLEGFVPSAAYLALVGAGALVCWILYTVLRLGAARWEYQVSMGQSPSAQELFYYFTNKRLFGRALSYFVRVPLRLCAYLALLCLPGSATIGYCVTYGVANTFVGSLTGWAAAGILLGCFLLVSGISLFVPLALRYFAARTAIVAYEEWRVRDCVAYSIRCMQGHKGSAMLLMLSFVGWMLLGYFILPLLGVLPYFRVSVTTCSKWLLHTGKLEEARYLPMEEQLYASSQEQF